MVRSNKTDLTSDLEEKKKVLDLRISSMEKQEKILDERAQNLKNEITRAVSENKR